MNPCIEKRKSIFAESPSNYSHGDTILSLLYEAYADLNNLDNTHIKAGFHALYHAMNGKDLNEMDQIIDPECALCREHQRLGFAKRVKMGMKLQCELESNALCNKVT